MKLSQMIVQALDEKSSPLQQLPHISLEVLRHFSTRKVCDCIILYRLPGALPLKSYVTFSFQCVVKCTHTISNMGPSLTVLFLTIKLLLFD